MTLQKKAATQRLRLIAHSNKNGLQNRHALRFNALRRLHFDDIYTRCLAAEVVFIGAAIHGTFMDFFSIDIENDDVLDVFSINSHLTVCWIGINCCDNSIAKPPKSSPRAGGVVAKVTAPVKLEQFLKAWSPINVTDSPMVRVPSKPWQ